MDASARRIKGVGEFQIGRVGRSFRFKGNRAVTYPVLPGLYMRWAYCLNYFWFCTPFFLYILVTC